MHTMLTLQETIKVMYIFFTSHVDYEDNKHSDTYFFTHNVDTHVNIQREDIHETDLRNVSS